MIYSKSVLSIYRNIALMKAFILYFGHVLPI